MERTEGFLARDGFKLHYWMGGADNAPLVVFTHGAMIDHRQWDATLPLVGEHFRVVTWDVRGHGQSRPPAFTFQEALDDLLAMLDALEAEQAVMVGHSMGGNLHQEFVFRHPERVKAMAFLGCTWNFQKLSALDALTLPLVGPMLRAYPTSLLVSQSLAATVASKAGQELLRPAMESHSKAEFAQILTALARCLHYEPGYAISKPLLLMVGDKDATGNIRTVMELWAKQEPDCRLVVIPNARHGANLDNPEFFHRTLMDFLLSRGLERGAIRREQEDNAELESG